ncbi:MAG: hypothetical protein V1792_08215 [Pseudomonadota bacterium]
MDTTNKAKVFISCGQRPAEMPSVREVESRLEKEGYDTYVAIEHRSLKTLQENIFHELSSSEYFLFIDFKREPIVETASDGSLRQFHRGSLFSHQELALTSFLQLEAVGFQQSGVRREGIMDAMQLNCFCFEDMRELPDLVMEAIEALGWHPCWKAQLHLGRSDLERGGSVADPPYIHHIEVRNSHRRKPAINCTAFLHEIKRSGSDEPIPFQKFELKWAGTTVPYVTIMPGESRSFDAFYMCTCRPTRLRWKGFSFTDTDKVCPDVRVAGTYELTYVVSSFNFPVIQAKFKLELKDTLDEVSPLTLTESRIVRPHEPY